MLLMGFAQVDITPDRPVEMVGFGRADEWSRGVEAPLLAQLSVWESGEEVCCLAAIDSIGFSVRNSQLLREALADAVGVTATRVMLCFSHTHSAPNESASPEYFRFVCEKLTGGAKSALKSMVPVHIGWGNVPVKIGVNRRGGRVDERAGVLRVCTENGAAALVLLRLTAHCNSLKADNYLLSPDYFGRVRTLLSGRCGCPVLLTQGAAGDVAPKYYDSKLEIPDGCGGRSLRSASALDDMAGEVLKAVAPFVEELPVSSVDFLAMYANKIDLWADVPNEEEARRTVSEAAEACGLDGRDWLAEVARLRAEGIDEQRETVEVQFFNAGGYTLCGVPDEVMCETALKLAERVGDENFHFGGYTNGCRGYLPTAEEFDRGGYEVYWSLLTFWRYFGRVWPLRRDSEERLAEFAVRNRREYSVFG